MAANKVAPLSVLLSSTVPLRLIDMWSMIFDPKASAAPAVPTASVALTKSSAGALNGLLNDASPGGVHVIGAHSNVDPQRGLIVLIDRLTHSGGLNATITTAQTTNLPTAALPRYTNGEGVMVGLVCWGTIGSTATTVTVSYTNQDGTPGQTTPAATFGASGNNAPTRLIALPLANGDRGVRSVESVTVAGSTGTAGNFGVVLFRPLSAIFLPMVEPYALSSQITGWVGGMPNINDACLSAIGHFTGSSSTGAIELLYGVG